MLPLLIGIQGCASRVLGQAPTVDVGTEFVLAPGEVRGVAGTDLTLTFVRIVGDSRCPTGVTCIREGDAVALLRVQMPGKAPSELTLHTSGPSSGEVVVDPVTIRLVDVTPHPSEGSKPRPEEYRATLLIRRK
jgi:hypothetical protein